MSSAMPGIVAQVVTELAAGGTRRRYPEGSLIFAQGDSSTDALLVRSGSVRVVVEERHHVVDLHEGDVLGEFAAIDGGPRSASAYALTDVDLVAISALDLAAGLGSQGVDLPELTAHTAELRRRTDARTLAAGGVPVSGVARRLAERAGHSGELEPLDPGELATSLGCGREVVSRALEHLADGGAIALDRGRIVVLDLPALRGYGAGA
ncbi:MAG TPA: Crp/Fnr family transcriptional regulator [Actinomycetes bacterium]|nr:Crp/Fnr family transcriptional regulator [Actinomycetes bacterium]